MSSGHNEHGLPDNPEFHPGYEQQACSALIARTLNPNEQSSFGHHHYWLGDPQDSGVWTQASNTRTTHPQPSNDLPAAAKKKRSRRTRLTRPVRLILPAGSWRDVTGNETYESGLQPVPRSASEKPSYSRVKQTNVKARHLKCTTSLSNVRLHGVQAPVWPDSNSAEELLGAFKTERMDETTYLMSCEGYKCQGGSTDRECGPTYLAQRMIQAKTGKVESFASFCEHDLKEGYEWVRNCTRCPADGPEGQQRATRVNRIGLSEEVRHATCAKCRKDTAGKGKGRSSGSNPAKKRMASDAPSSSSASVAHQTEQYPSEPQFYEYPPIDVNIALGPNVGNVTVTNAPVSSLATFEAHAAAWEQTPLPWDAAFSAQDPSAAGGSMLFCADAFEFPIYPSAMIPDGSSSAQYPSQPAALELEGGWDSRFYPHSFQPDAQ